jgi:Cu/Ag efflux pump CusA
MSPTPMAAANAVSRNYVVWSGQFEYLERATAWAEVVVPSRC